MRSAVVVLQRKVEEFVEAQVPASPGGGWAPVAEGDIAKLAEIVRELVACKYQTDADGDHPVEFQLIDRTRFERPHYFLVPYTYKVKTAAEYESAISNVVSNVAIAANALDVLHRCRAELLRREAAKAKEVKP